MFNTVQYSIVQYSTVPVEEIIIFKRSIYSTVRTVPVYEIIIFKR